MAAMRSTNRHHTLLLTAAFALTALLAACTSAPAGHSCSDICADAGSCMDAGADSGTMTSGASCLDRCNGLQTAIDPAYWSGVGECSATCGDPGSCVAAQASRVPASTVHDFLDQVCQWAVTCQAGLTVDQCVALLGRVGDDGGTSPWAALGLLRPEKRQCIVDCLRGGSCSDFGNAAQSCLTTCGLTGLPGFEDESHQTHCSGSCGSDCGGHGTCEFDTSICSNVCHCEPGYVPTINMTCVPDCHVGAGCGTGGTCNAQGLCDCSEGNTLGADFACHHQAKFVGVSVSSDGAILVRDDGRVEFIAHESTPSELAMRTDVTQVCLARTSTDFLCARRMDGSATCYGIIFGGNTLLSAPAGALDVACGNQFYCAVVADGSVMCGGIDAGPRTGTPPPIPSGLPPLVQISAMRHVCGRTAAGAVHCWGTATTSPSLLTPPASLTNARLVRVDDEHSCAIDGSGAVVCWGPNATMAPTGIGPVDQLAFIHNEACARRMDHTIVCWDMSTGQTHPPADNFSRPIDALMNQTITSVDADGVNGAFCATLEVGGGVVCFGDTLVGLPIASGRVQQPAVM